MYWTFFVCNLQKAAVHRGAEPKTQKRFQDLAIKATKITLFIIKM